MVMNRLEAARNLPKNQDPVKQFAIRQAGELLVAAGVEDPGMPIATPIENKNEKTPNSGPRVAYPPGSDWDWNNKGWDD